ncbi:MAG: SDR family NAD(P)-dependent oxidoreductase [Planctomycetaceae bacterium]
MQHSSCCHIHAWQHCVQRLPPQLLLSPNSLFPEVQHCHKLPRLSSDTLFSRSDAMELQNKVVVITGAAHGIGAALSHRLAQSDAAAVVVSDLDLNEAGIVADQIGGLAVACDVGGVKLTFSDWLQQHSTSMVVLTFSFPTRE